MVRIAGVDLPSNKRIEVALTYIYGIGFSKAREILAKTNISSDIRVKDLSGEDAVKLREEIEKGGYKIEGELRAEVAANIKRLIEIKSYRGIRHRLNLPVRGQRTRTNARQRKGPRVTVGSGRRKGGGKKG
jgi:small subunit ribosomal protein S13